ncbi:MAG: ABC transporter ATP-binding protein [Nitrospirota bacterium]
MSKPIIEIETISKRYRIGAHKEPYLSLRDEIAKKARRFSSVFSSGQNQASSNETDFWALKDVSFSVNEGEAVGIIGRNGAGKSTLLKILSQITPPTEGKITMRGRVASLLEVGTGFHPELTGRENIYLNGAILGMTRKEISRKFDEIVAFAEVEKFLDTPVKRYSSGMYVRLAFAVAAHLEPEILVVDEVLAVGDAEFQKKCLGKMGEVSNSGRTIIFVSHNMTAVQALCTHAIRLNSGKLVGYGNDVAKQIEDYLHCSSQRSSVDMNSPIKLGPFLYVKKFDVSPNPIVSGAALEFNLELFAAKPCRIDSLVILIYSLMGVRVAIIDLRRVAVTNAFDGSLAIKGGVKSFSLVEGLYQIGLYVDCDETRGDFLNLFELAVQSSHSVSEFVPYPSSARGLLELTISYVERDCHKCNAQNQFE